MKRILPLILILTLFEVAQVRGQQSPDNVKALLEKLFAELQTAKEDSARLSINDSIKSTVGTLALIKECFGRKFQEIKFLGQIISPDSTLKILTWNIALKDGKGCYFSYIIRRYTDGSPLNVTLLTRNYETGTIRSDTTYSSGDWYGALYYDIRPVVYEGRNSWMLLGISYSDPSVTKKIIDVLNYRQDGSLVFGSKWFDNGKAVRYRHILEYSSTAMITLRFASDNSIVFDHLVPVPGSGSDSRLVYGPDFSYDSFTFTDGIWKLSMNIDVRNPQK